MMSKRNYSVQKAEHINVCRESCHLCKRDNKYTDTRARIYLNTCLGSTCEVALAASGVGNWVAVGQVYKDLHCMFFCTV